ncbi:uncharacterized protein C2845_PM04G28080 [Panicum miliaceum]|uniref:DUF7870 domain-containing protein n=1 Tax=Panicum miliaceum TaxID=4540 RepID=A0A3L6QS48_PANMI|nr:uncharacterized protein C2845_PM04G28080 [Panicum miliaceum]
MDPRRTDELMLLCLRCRSTRVALVGGNHTAAALPASAPANPAPAGVSLLPFAVSLLFPCAVLFLGIASCSELCPRLGSHEDSGENDGCQQWRASPAALLGWRIEWEEIARNFGSERRIHEPTTQPRSSGRSVFHQYVLIMVSGRSANMLLLTVLVLSIASLSLALANGGDLQLPILLAELKDHGYLRHGGRAVFLGDAASWLPFLERNHIAPVSSVQLRAIPDGSVDFVVRHGDGVEFGLLDRVLKAPGRAEEDVLAGLEGVLLEPPQKRHVVRRLRPKYLPELTGDSLEGYRRRVFIDITPAPGSGAASWFKKHYPRGRYEFESVRLTAAAGAQSAAAASGIGDWLEGNMREEDYVVVKAGVEAAEEMLRQGAAVVRRVDELFLDCGEGDGATSNSGRRPYWTLAMPGPLRTPTRSGRRRARCTNGGAACSSEEKEKRELKMIRVQKQRVQP